MLLSMSGANYTLNYSSGRPCNTATLWLSQRVTSLPLLQQLAAGAPGGAVPVPPIWELKHEKRAECDPPMVKPSVGTSYPYHVCMHAGDVR